MTTLKHNSKEYIKSQIYYGQYKTTVTIYSEDICKNIESAVDRDEAFNEVVEYISEMLGDDFETEYQDLGSSCSQTWTKRE